MDQLQQFIGRGRLLVYALIAGSNLILIGLVLCISEFLNLAPIISIAAAMLLALLLPLTIIWFITNMLTRPLLLIRQAIMYLGPASSGVRPPKLDSIQLGKTLTTNLVQSIYNLAGGSAAGAPHDTPVSDFVAGRLPLPLVIFDKDNILRYANPAFAAYTGLTADQTQNKSLYDILNISFSSDDTLDTWLTNSKALKATDSRVWERVRLGEPTDANAHLFDLIAYYNKGNLEGYETMLVLFDRTTRYGQDDQAIGFIAMAVHELRMPLTMLRGYIEALEEELDEALTPELRGFMQKMQTSAQQLAAFVTNILNVARVEDGQMFLHLKEERWQDVLQATIDDLALRAQIRGITIKTEIDPTLPTVAIDRVSTYQIVGNLIDNAIKYSGQSKEIIVSAKLNQEGQIETTVQDFGAGIPESAVPHLFEKFYRDHHNRAQVGGTGLGLFLCKTLVTGHGGNIWVRSKEKEGSTFGFTLMPFANLAEELKNSDNKDIVRGAHGWIKNHSLYRD